jgi:hypothetical protein
MSADVYVCMHDENVCLQMCMYVCMMRTVYEVFMHASMYAYMYAYKYHICHRKRNLSSHRGCLVCRTLWKYIHTYIHTYKQTYHKLQEADFILAQGMFCMKGFVEVLHTYIHFYIHTYVHTYHVLQEADFILAQGMFCMQDCGSIYIHTYIHTYISYATGSGFYSRPGNVLYARLGRYTQTNWG